MRFVLALFSAAFLGGCSLLGFGRENDDPPPPLPAPRTTWIVGTSGTSIGQATFTETPAGVLIRLEFLPSTLPPGWHAAHIHQIGDCSDFTAGFMAAGVHEGLVGDAQHGLRNHHGPDAGDLPNIFTPPGEAISGAEMFSSRLTLRRFPTDGRFSLLDDNGAALVIHANPDDHQAVPSGPRIACAPLTPTP
jgi:superoxide dismutase, Cu-Zn family